MNERGNVIALPSRYRATPDAEKGLVYRSAPDHLQGTHSRFAPYVDEQSADWLLARRAPADRLLQLLKLDHTADPYGRLEELRRAVTNSGFHAVTTAIKHAKRLHELSDTEFDEFLQTLDELPNRQVGLALAHQARALRKPKADENADEMMTISDEDDAAPPAGTTFGILTALERFRSTVQEQARRYYDARDALGECRHPFGQPNEPDVKTRW